jgi:DNA-directed RNA polymerase specialized sigma subunit
MTTQNDKTTGLFHEWKSTPGPRTLTPLITALEPQISKALHTHGYESDPNVRTSVRLHLAKSLERFDPEKSHINTFVTNELKRVGRIGARHRYAIPVPEQASLDLKNIDQHTTQLSSDLGREPTVDEVSDATGLSARRISRLQSTHGMPTVTRESLEERDFAEPATEAVDPDELWVEAVYDGLDPYDKKILDWSLGWHGQQQLTKTEMARRLGMSVSAVTQRAQRIAIKLEEGMEYRL